MGYLSFLRAWRKSRGLKGGTLFYEKAVIQVFVENCIFGGLYQDTNSCLSLFLLRFFFLKDTTSLIFVFKIRDFAISGPSQVK